VLAYNLPGVESLKLSREAYSGIFLGKITKWNDPAIAKTNEGVKLPATAMTVCGRSDGSGTTFVLPNISVQSARTSKPKLEKER